MTKAEQRPWWNYRSYHWARASGPTNESFGVEFNHNGVQIYQGSYKDGQGGDINPALGVWVHEEDRLTQVRENTDVHAYTAIWSPNRNDDNAAEASLAGRTPAW